MTLSFAVAVRDTWNNSINTLANAGSGAATIEVRSGTRPANADTAPSGGALLATFTCTDPAFDGSSSAGVITLDADPDLTATAGNTGTASWARMKDSDGNTIMDGTVATSAADFIITSTSITSGQTVTLVTGTITQPA